MECGAAPACGVEGIVIGAFVVCVDLILSCTRKYMPHHASLNPPRAATHRCSEHGVAGEPAHRSRTSSNSASAAPPRNFLNWLAKRCAARYCCGDWRTKEREEALLPHAVPRCSVVGGTQESPGMHGETAAWELRSDSVQGSHELPAKTAA